MRLLLITAPLWAPFYFIYQRDWLMVLVSLVYAPILFPVGILLHGSCFISNTFDRGRSWLLKNKA